MLYYLRVYPYAVHHPKEERHLFPAAAAKDAGARAAVAALHKEHAEGYVLLQGIEIAAADAGGKEGLARLKQAILDYVGHEFRHMEREEKEILPVVERTLDAEAITAMRRTFAAHADPVFSENIEAGFDALYRHIKAKIETKGF
jgi:hemerythrin-like domain-containing protein